MIFIVPPADFVIKNSQVLIVMGDKKMLEKVMASRGRSLLFEQSPQDFLRHLLGLPPCFPGRTHA